MTQEKSALRHPHQPQGVSEATRKPRKNERPAIWTYSEEDFKAIGEHLYYFAPANAAPPPYRTQREVIAIIDIADDGTLAGVELVYKMPPPPVAALTPLPAEGLSRPLIVAAPKMLAALQKITGVLRSDLETHLGEKIATQIREAIADATNAVVQSSRLTKAGD
jgi:hypothetical protein